MKLIPIYVVWFKTRHGAIGHESPTTNRDEAGDFVNQIKAIGGVAVVRTAY